MANKRQIKKNLKRYSQKIRGKSRRNIRTATEKPSVATATITINPATMINVVEVAQRPAPAQMFGVK